jgi:hypothetical protein
MAWASDADISAYVAEILSNTHGLDSRYSGRVTNANTEAKYTIMQALRGRGYTATQINTWALQKVTHLDLAAVYVIDTMDWRQGSPNQIVRDKMHDKVTRRLSDDQPLVDTNGDAIDGASHDDNWIPTSARGPESDSDRTLSTIDDIDGIQ